LFQSNSFIYFVFQSTFNSKHMRRYFPKSMKHAPRIDFNKPTKEITERSILLVNPFYPKDPVSSFGKHVLTPTLALTSFAGATPNEWDLNYWDENLLQGHLPYKTTPQIVGITVHLTTASRAFEIAKFYRNRGSIVIMGGLHANSCPEELVPHCDILVQGEGVKVWPQILDDIKNEKEQQFYKGSFDRNYHLEPAPKRDILPKPSFLTSSSMIATRGCSNRCDFCYLATKGLKVPYSARKPKQIAAELRQEKASYAVFTDNNLGMDHNYLRELCTELEPLEIMWNAAVTIDVTDDPTLVRDMALAGCTGVFVGLESLTTANILDSNKKSPAAEDYARRVALFHEYGINVNGSFVFGFDHDTEEVFERTIEWVEENKLACATFHILTPYPGTPLFRQMEEDGRILHNNWDLYDTAHVVFKPKGMTADQLVSGYKESYRRLFSLRSIWKRRPSKVTSVPAYLAATLLYKRSNMFWHLLIKFRLTNIVWRPLVELSRRRNLSFRKKLRAQESAELSRSQRVDMLLPGV